MRLLCITVLLILMACAMCHSWRHGYNRRHGGGCRGRHCQSSEESRSSDSSEERGRWDSGSRRGGRGCQGDCWDSDSRRGGRGCQGDCWDDSSRSLDRDDYLEELMRRLLRNRGNQGPRGADGAVDETCLEKADQLDCSFFECFSQRFPGCDNNNTVIDISLRNCRKFDELSSQFTTTGRQWINESRACAMGLLRDKYENKETYCCCSMNRYIKHTIMQCMESEHMCEAFRDNTEYIFEVFSFQGDFNMRFMLNILRKVAATCEVGILQGILDFFEGDVDLAALSLS